MLIFYIICALLNMASILCNLYLCPNGQKIKGGLLVFGVVLGLTPFVNALVIAAMVVVGVAKGGNKI